MFLAAHQVVQRGGICDCLLQRSDALDRAGSRTLDLEDDEPPLLATSGHEVVLHG